jgi:hypothetical protein
MKRAWVVGTSTKPYDKAKMIEKMELDPTELKHQGKMYHKSKKGQEAVVSFVNDKMVIVCPNEDSIKLALDQLTGNRKITPGKLANTIGIAGGKEQIIAGFVVPPEAKAMAGMAGGPPGGGVPKKGGVKGKQPPAAGPGMGPDFTPLLELQSGSVTIQLTGNTATMELSGDFGDQAKAAKAKEVLDALKGMIPMVGMMLPDMAEPMKELNNSLAISQAGTLVKVKASSSYKPEQLAKVMDALPMRGPGMAAAGAGPVGGMMSENNLKQIGLAFHNYAGANNGKVPADIKGPDGKPLLSWRVVILPYMEGGGLYNKFKLNEPWDSPNNKPLLAQMPQIYALPSRPAPGKTHYKMYTGPGTLFSGNPVMLPGSFQKGTSNMILAVEANQPVDWSKPEDINFRQLADPVFPLLFQNGVCNAVFWDGSIHKIKQTVQPQNLANAITPTGTGTYQD